MPTLISNKIATTVCQVQGVENGNNSSLSRDNAYLQYEDIAHRPHA